MLQNLLRCLSLIEVPVLRPKIGHSLSKESLGGLIRAVTSR